MRVSIVTISFNQAPFLERAIRSVLEQDYPDIEYVIVDPGSTDGSREIIERYRSRIARVIFEPDHGPADGLNKGFAVATGEICGYINADDAYLQGTVRKAVDAFGTHPTADVMYAHGYIVDVEGRVIRRFRSTKFSPWRFVYGGVVVMQQSTFFRSQAWADIGGFEPESRTMWDAELLVDMSVAGKRMVLVHDDWAIFSVYGSSITGTLVGVARGQEVTERGQQLRLLGEQDFRRVSRKILGREPCFYDQLLRPAVRVQKWVLDPAGFAQRLGEVVRSRPNLQFREGQMHPR